jgi:tetratricopeptide (TPR) repeat protein
MSPGGTGAGGAAPTHPPVAAFENYIKGLLAETPATAINYLNAALQADPRFDRVRLALWEIYDEQGEHQKALTIVTPVPPTSEIAHRARFLVGLSQLNLQRLDDAFATFKALADARPEAPTLNNLGVIQLRRSIGASAGQPAYYFNEAVETDPSDPDYCFNLGYAYWLERDVPAALHWLREAVRRDPTDGTAHYVLAATLTSTGSTTEAARERELARRLSSTFADWEKRPAADPVPGGLERIKAYVSLPRARRLDEALTGGQRDQRELARFYLDRAKRLFREERDGEALAESSRTVFLSPYEAEAHLLIGRIHLRGGRVRDAIDALKISLWSAESADAHAVLAAAHAEAGEIEAARTEATRAIALDPSSSEARRVLDSLPPR